MTSWTGALQSPATGLTSMHTTAIPTVQYRACRGAQGRAAEWASASEALHVQTRKVLRVSWKVLATPFTRDTKTLDGSYQVAVLIIDEHTAALLACPSQDSAQASARVAYVATDGSIHGPALRFRRTNPAGA